METVTTKQALDFKALAEAYASAMRALAGDGGELQKQRAELARYKKIIGNYHPTEQSPTYHALMDKDKQQTSEIDTLKSQLKQLQAENMLLKEDREKQEQEILLLRRNAFPKEALQTETKKQKKPSTRRRGKAGSSPEKLSEEEKRARLRNHLLFFHRHYSDLQVRFLTNVLSDSQLPADDLARLFDPTMTSGRMEQFYRMLCSKHHISVPETKPAVDTNKNCNENTVAEAGNSAAASSRPSVPFLEVPQKQRGEGAVLKIAEKLMEQTMQKRR